MVTTNLDLEHGRSPAEADAISPWMNQRTDLPYTEGEECGNPSQT